MANETENKVTVNGSEYDIAELSDKAREQMMNLRVCDAEIARIKSQLAIAQTARNAYMLALTKLLPVKAQ
jgi:hypothetical protein